jgi:archaellum biogenesis ATPase FlaH
MGPKEIEALASTFLWEEINEPVGIRLKEAKQISRVFDGKKVEIEQRIWQSVDSGQEFVTLGESDRMFVWDELGQGLQSVTKWEAINQLHFNKDSRLTRSFLKSGSKLRPSILDEIQELRRDVVFDELGHLSLKQRYHLDPALKVAVNEYWKRLEAQEEGARRHRESQANLEQQTPASVGLDDFLKEEDSEQSFRVQGLIPTGSTVTVVGARKVGKTTFMYNLLNSYLTGAPLLGAFETTQVSRRIGYVNMELTEAQARSWFRRSPIQDASRVSIWNLRGMPNPFRSDLSAERFAKEVSSLDIEVMILDPFSGIFTSDKRNSLDNDEVKNFLLKLEAFKASSGVSELVIPVHAGWDGSRSRGASSLEDHPDAILTIECDKSGVRTFSAIGRDVEVEPRVLEFDSSTGVLSLSGGTLRDTKLSSLKEKMFDVVLKSPDISASELATEVRGSKLDISRARKQLLDEGRIEMTVGTKGRLSFKAAIHASSPMLATATELGTSGVVASAYISGANDDELDKAYQFTYPKCDSHSYSNLEAFGLRLTICDDCFDVSEAAEMSG